MRGDTAGFQRVIDEAVGRVDYQIERIIATADPSTNDGRSQLLRKIIHILSTVPSRAERDIYVERVWRYHPLSASGPSPAKEQLHRDTEEYAARQAGVALPTHAAPAVSYDRAGPYSNRPAYGKSDSYRGGGRRTDYRGDGRPERFQALGPPPVAAGGLTAEQRADREIIRALADPEWRKTALGVVEEHELVTEEGRRFYRFVAAHQAEMGYDASDVVDLLNRFESEEFALAFRQYLQEISTLSEKLPLNEALIRGSAQTLKKHHLERRKQLLSGELARLVQISEVSGTLSSAEKQRMDERMAELWKELNETERSAATQGE